MRDFDKNSLRGKLNIPKIELCVKRNHIHKSIRLILLEHYATTGPIIPTYFKHEYLLYYNKANNGDSTISKVMIHSLKKGKENLGSGLSKPS